MWGTEKGIKCSIFILRSRAGVSSILCFNSRLALSFRRLLSRISFRGSTTRFVHYIQSQVNPAEFSVTGSPKTEFVHSLLSVRIPLTDPTLKSLIRTAYERRSFFFAILPLVSPTARGLAKPLQAQAQPSASCRRVFWPRSEQARACACATDGGCRSRWRQDTRDRPTREEVSYVKTAASRGALSNKREAPSLDPRSLFFLLDPTNTNGALQIGADQRSFLVTM